MKRQWTWEQRIQAAAEADEQLDAALEDANDVERYAFMCPTHAYLGNHSWQTRPMWDDNCVGSWSDAAWD